MEDGTNFTYRNPFGGFWVDNPDDPFNNGAQAQSWVPALNETWDWNKNRAFGVNLAGWLVLEPFITPAYFEKYPGTLDEWSLSLAIANDPSSGGLQTVLENHYNTFVTEQDFAQIAGAGLSWVRIPFPFWAIEVRNAEPFLEGVSWTYFLKAIKWARKYGIRINLDLHTLPGSQNGYNHGGKQGSLDFLNGVMGIANAQRAVEYVRIITEFISEPEYSNIVPIFGIVNEPTIPIDVLSNFYLESHNMIRNISGYGAGNGPFISIHDAFTGPEHWVGYMVGADRLIIDSHPYFCFGPPDASPFAQQVNKPCTWGAGFNNSMMDFGVTTAGEWSLGFNDCGKWINGVGSGSRWEGTFGGSGTAVGNCSAWTEWSAFTASTKASLNEFALSSMDALPNWFFWTWKVGNSSITGQVEAPLWSYSLGLEHGWIPSDPRTSLGTCRAAGDYNPITASLQPTATGGPGAGTIAPTFVSSYSAWPPTSLPSIPDATLLPTYTATQGIPTLAAPTYTARNGTKIVGGTGWFNVNDHAQAPVNISGCTYPDPWNAVDLPIPTTSFCAAGATRRALYPAQTQAPAR
ncbi:glycoside hydrolase family 5 protein [Hydnum rufescens UP504]|uniref:glucan 1,3-beta-glucosidase n=1 Tax=Hydnum rufescens UP504 TaxID=1448309 RepID=A0A9P6AWT2_9AGAM|nr:glycoside hydrolase family 5 protein [Hydnum rufescens UP504]